MRDTGRGAEGRGGTRSAVGAGLERLVLWPVEHWLLLANALAAATVLGALAAPLLRVADLGAAAAWIDALYHNICPQRPSHSFFLLGYQVPLEQRMLAMAAAQLAGGLIFGALRGRLRPLDWRLVLVCALPMVADVFSQTLGLRDSTWLLRSLTGSLATLAAVFWAYPFLDRWLGPTTGTRVVPTGLYERGPSTTSTSSPIRSGPRGSPDSSRR